MASQKKIPLPKPVFDTIQSIDDLPYGIIKNFLASLNVNDILSEYNIILNFLKSYTGSNDTFISYRREIEKLLQWSWLVENRLIKTLNRNDLVNYMDFIQNPPDSWIATKNVKRFIIDTTGNVQFNKEWRPFVVRIPKADYKEGKIPYKHNFSMSAKSIQAAFSTLSTFFTYLTQEQYITTNPVALIRQKSKYLQKHQNSKITRKLSDLQWETVINLIKEKSEENNEYLRSYFILSAFYLLGLRVSELSETEGRIPTMGDFAPDHNDLWWFTTVGKGNKQREVAVPAEMLSILKAYRISRGLSPLPRREETSPLIHKSRGKEGLGTRQIRNIVQQAFNIAIQHLKNSGKTDEAIDLENATVHWLRHTAISNDVKHRPREHIRDDVGHANPATMDKYIDIDKKARHKSAYAKRLIPNKD